MRKNKLNMVIYKNSFAGNLTLLDLCYALENLSIRENKLQHELERLADSYNIDTQIISKLFLKADVSNTLDMIVKLLKDEL